MQVCRGSAFVLVRIVPRVEPPLSSANAADYMCILIVHILNLFPLSPTHVCVEYRGPDSEAGPTRNVERRGNLEAPLPASLYVSSVRRENANDGYPGASP